ncbi:MAG: TIR domain-containing protein [Ktedonobacterales bacterium]
MRIFVSHTYTDTIITRSLVQALRAAGADAWCAETPDDTMQLTHESMAELKARPVFLAVLSPDALRSPAMQQSALIASSNVHWRVDHIALGVVVRTLGINPRESIDVLAEFEREISRPDGAFKMPNLLLELPRISAPNGKPYPATELVGRTLRALALGLADATHEPAETPVDAGARE